MPITVKWYGQGMRNVLRGNVDMDTDTLKLLLATSTYTPDLDAHDFRDDVTNELANGNGYTTGGVTLTTPVVSYDAASNQIRADFDDPSWAFVAAKTWRYGVVYKSRGGLASADELVSLLDWGSDQTVSTPYTLQLNAAGLLYVDVT